MNIAFFETEGWEKEYFQKSLGTGNTLSFFDKPLEKKDLGLLQETEILVTFIYSRIAKDVIDELPKLACIATMSTGFDHIDIEEVKKRNILVLNVPTYGEHTVAEHAFALILAISRRIIESYKRVHEWQFSPEGLTGFDLYGKTIGVVGVGNIGKHVIKIARGLEMNVLAQEHHPNVVLAQELGYTSVSLDRLLAESDVISLHIPYMPETHHFLNREKFQKMKDGVVVINTARGALIDTDALFHALESGKVRAAGLDVLEQEPLIREEKQLLSKHHKKEELLSVLENHMLLSHPNVVITPHNAFNSHEALHNIVQTTCENILSFISGTPQNTVQ